MDRQTEKAAERTTDRPADPTQSNAPARSPSQTPSLTPNLPNQADVLLISPRPKTIARIERALDRTSLTLAVCDDATDPVRDTSYKAGVALIDADDEETGVALAAALALELEDRDAAPVCVVLAEHISTDEALELMRCGVSDVLSPRMRATELRARLASAVERAARRRGGSEEVQRLRRLCGKLEQARRELSGRVGGLCNELVTAYRDLSERVGDVSLASEVNSLFRQELDIEGLLRTFMETLLAKLGPTNAVVFLPDSGGEFSVGAYINHDCPKASAETLLDQLACTLPGCVEGQPGLIDFNTSAQLEDGLGEAAHWMAGSSLLALSCDDEEECLGVVAVFRESTKGFSEADRKTVSILTPLFAAQLARVIRVHHRHLPEASWGFETGPDASADGAEDWGDDFGSDDQGGWSTDHRDDDGFGDGFGDDYGMAA